MERKPTKEELEEYYINNKTYFDNLAKHFYENDSEYYANFILPVIENPPVPKKESVLSAHFHLIVGIATAIIIIGSLVMIYFSLKH
jgi:hypothetical protein